VQRPILRAVSCRALGDIPCGLAWGLFGRLTGQYVAALCCAVRTENSGDEARIASRRMAAHQAQDQAKLIEQHQRQPRATAMAPGANSPFASVKLGAAHPFDKNDCGIEIGGPMLFGEKPIARPRLGMPSPGPDQRRDAVLEA
jgi:hypothetical protein